MRTAMFLAVLLIGCTSTGAGFGESKPTTVEAGGEGRVTIFPTDGVNIGPFEVGYSEIGGFRIDSTGDFPLQVLSMPLIDAGEVADQAVFADLRPHVSSNVVPFDIRPGEGAEFLLTASMTEAGTATGAVEIYTNDSTVNDSGPGYVRVPLSAVAHDPGAGSGGRDDTGHTESDDTGDSASDEPVEDTGTTEESSEEGK